MADNVIANPGSGGPAFATDDISGIHYPISKIAVGALDAATLLSGGNGAVDGGTVRVTLATDSTGQLIAKIASDPKTSFASDVAVAPGGTANLDSTAVSAAKTGKLLSVRASSSVPWKADLQVIANGVAGSTKAVWFWNDPTPLQIPSGAISVADSGGVDGFRIVMTNLDVAQVADLYAFFVWDEE